jgi:asparagine synthase (glutamine-hydrolysing)
MSMAASLESRVPFLDHKLVEFTATIPAKYSIRGMAGKFILKEAVEDILPRSIVYRKKMGFPTPWESWLSGSQLDDLERMLLDPKSIERGFFRPEAIKQIFAEHRQKSQDHANRIWRLLNFEIWYRIMFEGAPLENTIACASNPAAALTP